MIAWLLLLAFIPACIGILWVLYMAVMNLKHARDSGALTAHGHVMGEAVLVLGLTWDFFCNMVPVSLLFLEIPRELLVTSRIQRLCDGKDGWRKALAIWFAVNMLNPFDPSGQHITLNKNDQPHVN